MKSTVAHGGLFESRIALPGHAEPITVVTAKKPHAGLGNPVLLLGAIVDDPAKNLTGYHGADAMVIFGDVVVAPPNSDSVDSTDETRPPKSKATPPKSEVTPPKTEVAPPKSEVAPKSAVAPKSTVAPKSAVTPPKYDKVPPLPTDVTKQLARRLFESPRGQTGEMSDVPAAATLPDLSAAAIAGRVAAGEVSAADVLEEHLTRIEAVDGQLHAVVVRRFEAARAEAAVVDRNRLRGEPLGPLAGVPVTVKECFQVAGLPTTIGVGRLSGQVAAKDGPLVVALRRAGAIVVGKTNVPQLMLLYESDNPVYGRTNNPWDGDRSPGGSSGGEAAIIAAGGVPLGLGTDLAGSIRQPAHSCGIHGLKPTLGRLSNQGMLHGFHGLSGIGIQAGPMARRVEDLSLAMRILARADDPPAADAIPVAWHEPAEIDLTALRIGFWIDDGYFSASPAIRRATEEAAAALRDMGVAVEPVEPPDAAEAMRIFFGLIAADGCAELRQLLARARPIRWSTSCWGEPACRAGSSRS